MLSTPEASAYLFNTSSLQANAQFFIRFQGQKIPFFLMIQPSAAKSGSFRGSGKKRAGPLIRDFSFAGRQTGTLHASTDASPGGRMRLRAEIVSGFAHLRSI
ncbi:hypothetical protein [Rhizobium sp. L43]|uniref:hypothetical protein n=1 Tax=Rhizobium sp. L43 TaxID=2035452 RepID=UPI00117B5892|nr:hypothetical protein [Rhizobium sp. L43]